MEKGLKSFQCLISAISLISILAQVRGQPSTICSAAMSRSFSSCINYLRTGSTASSPTEACCNSLKNLMANGQDCLCLIVTGGAPFPFPLNLPLALSLPRACKISGLAVECRATTSPVSAPVLPDTDEDNTREYPPEPESDVVPEMTPPGMRPTLLPSAAHLSHTTLPSLLGTLAIFLAVQLLLGFHFYSEPNFYLT